MTTTNTFTNNLSSTLKELVNDPSGNMKKLTEVMGTEGGVVCDACFCCYRAIDISEVTLCCNKKGQCICLTHECCIDMSLAPYAFEVTKTDDSITVGVGICLLGLTRDFKNPCFGTDKCLCCRNTYQILPTETMGDLLPSPLCACCFIECLPSVAFANQTPPGNFKVGSVREGAPSNSEIER